MDTEQTRLTDKPTPIRASEPGAKVSSELNERASRMTAAWQPNWTEVSSMTNPAQWQWLHKSGWRDYDPHTNKRIEVAYRDGRSFVLVKSGKKGNAPMGIFFADMLQHDANTGNKRKVQRVGPETCLHKMGRKLLWAMRYFEKSNFVKRNFLEQEVEDDALAAVDVVQAPVTDMYHKRGCPALIARSPFFMPFTAFVIVVNALWLGFDAEYNHALTLYSAEWGFIFVENVFFAYFTVELLIRFLAYKEKRICLADTWFIFDSILLTLMMGEIWLIPLYIKIFYSGNPASGGGWAVLRAARMLKLVRLARLARIIQKWPELYAMCKAIIYALRSTSITIILLVLLTYVFAIIFVTQLRHQSEEVLEELPDFKTIRGTMWLLTIEGVLLDGPKDTLSILVEFSHAMTALFLIFIGISAFTLVNMLIGIICNVVDSVKKTSEDEADVLYLKNTMLEFLECHDDDNDRHIKKEEFRTLLRNPLICLILTRFGVDVDDLRSMENNFFGHEDAIDYLGSDSFTLDNFKTDSNDQSVDVPFSQFLRVVLRLRQTNAVKVTDVVDLREFIKKGMDSHCEYIDQRLRSMERRMQDSFALAAPSIGKLPKGSDSLPKDELLKEEKVAAAERKLSELGQPTERASFVLEQSREGTQDLLSASLAERSGRVDFSPLRTEAWGGLEKLLSIQAEMAQKGSAMEKEVLLSREQLSDIQKQVGQVCRLLGGQGRLTGSGRMPQASSHPWHLSQQQRPLINSLALGATLTEDLRDEISPNDVEV